MVKLRSMILFFGIVLFLAAVAKFYLLVTDPFFDLLSGYPKSLLWLTVTLEATLGCLVIKRVQTTLLWVCYLSFFVALLFASVLRFAAGFETCHCLGPLKVPIWVTPVFNLAAISILTILRPPWELIKRTILDFSFDSNRIGMLAGVGIAVAALLVLNHPVINSRIMANLGSNVFPDQRISVGELSSDKMSEIRFSMENKSTSNLTIAGSKRSCQCIILTGHDQVVRPGEAGLFTLQIAANSAGRWHQRIVIYVDHPDQNRIVVDLVGMVL